jgi:GNAT superfamily N-acetyltransferase
VEFETLVKVFNQAFSDYQIDVYFSPSGFWEYVERYLIDLDRSLVAERDGLMVGLLLSGEDDTRTWNAGMGIHPKWRRKGIGGRLLDLWLADAAGRGCREALLEVIVGNQPAESLYVSRGFRSGRSYVAFEGRPRWKREAIMPPEDIIETTPAELLPHYRDGHSWQKRPRIVEGLRGFTALRSRGTGGPQGPGYLIYDIYGELMYIFDLTPNPAGRGLFEHAVERERPKLIRIVNTIDQSEGEFYTSMGFKPWITNTEMHLDLRQGEGP